MPPQKSMNRFILISCLLTGWIFSVPIPLKADDEINLAKEVLSSQSEISLMAGEKQRKLDFIMITTAEAGLGMTLGAISHFFNTPFNPERIRMEEIRQQIIEIQKAETAESIFERITRFKSDQRNIEFVPAATPGNYDTDLRYEAKTALADLEAQLYKARSDGLTKEGIKKKVALLNQELQHVAERGLISSGLRNLAKVSRFIAWVDGIMVAVDIVGAGVMTFILDIEPLPFMALYSGHKFLSPLPKHFFESATNLYSQIKQAHLPHPDNPDQPNQSENRDNSLIKEGN